MVFFIVDLSPPTFLLQIPYELVDRRPGDVASCYASCRLAEVELGWRAERNLRDMCK
jgi:UDP-glucose 4-epimerase